MADYRAFVFNGRGHIGAAHEFEAETDDAAWLLCAEWAEDGPVELWSGARLIRRSPGCDLPAPKYMMREAP